MGQKIKTLILAVVISILPVLMYTQETAVQSENTTLEQSNLENPNQPDTYFLETENKDSETEFKSPSTVWLFVKMILVLGCIIAVIYALMLFFKKRSNLSKSDDDYLRRVSSLNLSPGKSIEIITLLDQAYILGVTDGGINLIDEVKDKELISALNLNFDNKQNVTKPMNFNDVLEMFVSKNKKKDIYSDIKDNVRNLDKNK